MKDEISFLKEQFIKIKKQGWIKSIRKKSTGVGTTLEYYLGITENKSEAPDFYGIEIKTKRNNSKAYTALFNCKPLGNKEFETERIRNTYGYVYRKAREYKVLNNSVFSTETTNIGVKYRFRLEVNREEKKIYLLVFDINMNLIDKTTYWEFETLKEKLYKKLKYLAFFDAKRIIRGNSEYFKYYKMSVYKLKSFNEFINLIEDGKIRITFKIGVFLSGNRKGETHDHGTSFDIEECNLLKLFDFVSDY